MNNFYYAFLISTIAGLSTMLGCLFIFIRDLHLIEMKDDMRLPGFMSSLFFWYVWRNRISLWMRMSGSMKVIQEG